MDMQIQEKQSLSKQDLIFDGECTEVNIFQLTIRKLREKSNLSSEKFFETMHSVSGENRTMSESDRFNALDGTLKGYDCPKCRNKGVIYYDRNGEMMCRKCECMPVRDSIFRIEKSGLKSVLGRYTFDKYITEQPFQKGTKNKALDFIKNHGKWFFIGGQIGCGKSHICTAIVAEYLKQGKSARYMQWRDDVVNLKSNANTPEYERLIKPFKKTDVLYIDDLFKTESGKAPTTADINIAFEIINQRYINPDFITIISSERIIQDIVKIDEAVASRICEYAGEYMINISPDKHKNYRLRGII